MQDIQFNCPQCGQHLTVDASCAGMTVACPKCSQAIIVPQMARIVATAQRPKSTKWAWFVAAIGVIALLAAGVLTWETHGRPPTRTAPIGVSSTNHIASPAGNSRRLTPEMLYGKQFRYSWKSRKGSGVNGIATLHSNGLVSGVNPNHWLIDGQGRLVFKYRNGSVSTVFTHTDQRDGKWFFAGTWLRDHNVENLLEEVSPETARTVENQLRERSEQRAADKLKARRVKALTDALQVFRKNDPETANLLANILTSLNQRGGLTTNELVHDMERMKNRVRELVRHGDMEHAAALNHAQIMTFYSYNFPSQPPDHHRKVGGTPGPGGLVLYLPFDQPATNGVVQDESGAGNDGHVFGAQWVPDGKFGGAYRFSITDFDDRIVIPDSDSFDAKEITVAAWIKAPADTGFFERILDKDFYHGFALSLSGDWQGSRDRGKLLWETGNGDVTGRRADYNQWHHVAAVYDSRTVRCYVDGVDTSHRTRKTGPMSKSGWDLCIGNSVVNYGWEELMAFNGLIDEVRIYNRALSPADIKSLATATHAGVDVISTASGTALNDEAAGHSENLNQPEDQAWLAWAKRLPISPNPVPQIIDRNKGLTPKDFSDYPLFGPKGPSEDDVLQGSGGDCNFLARLAGLAAAHPDFIRKVINDVGDGTYVVHYWRLQNHHQYVIRVNGDLWVDRSGRLKYAQIGPDRAIWPAILEKVYALTRRPPYNYKAIFGGGKSIFYIPVDWDYQPPLDESLPEPFSPQVVADWFNNSVSNCPIKNQLIRSNKWLWFNSGAPDGPIKDAVFNYAIQRLKWFKSQLDAGTIVVVGAWGRLNNDTPVIPPNPVEIEKHLPRTDTYRSNAQHEYTLVRVLTDKNRKPIGVILRNPGGPIQRGMIGRHYLILDYTRVYFCLQTAIYIRPCDAIQFLPPSLEKATSN